MALAGSQARDIGGRLHHKVAITIALGIVEGRWPLSDPLPNDRILTAHFKTSRTVIREAIQRLAVLRVLNVRHGAGTFPNPVAVWDVRDPELLNVVIMSDALGDIVDDLLDMRRIVESEAAALAAQRASQAEIADIKTAFEEMLVEQVVLEPYLDLHGRFHRLIIRASHNRMLETYADQMDGLQRAIMRRYFEWRRTNVPGAQQSYTSSRGSFHESIVLAIAERRPDRARQAMLTHLQSLERIAGTLFPHRMPHP